jgi:hypothetical protein
MYYHPYLSSRAATILWGRLVTCGGLSIRLPAATTIPENRQKSLRRVANRPATPYTAASHGPIANRPQDAILCPT